MQITTINRTTSRISRINPLYAAIALSLLMLTVILLIRGVVHNGDTPSYISAWTDYISQGEIDNFRTPVYPVVIGIAQTLCGSYWEAFIIVMQAAVFYLCGICFSRMAFGIISNRLMAWVAVFLYFLFFPIVNFIPVIGTEVLAFSFAVLWGYSVWRFMQRAQWGYGIAIGILTLTEIMLRPSFLILAIAIVGLAAAGIFIRRYRRQSLLMLLTLIPSAVTCWFYMLEIERQAGIRTISVVSTYNKYFMAREYNDILPDLLADNPEALEVQLRFQKTGNVYEEQYILRMWAEIIEFEDTGIMSYRQLEDYADAMKDRYPELWYGNILRNITMSMKHQGAIKNICNDMVILLFTVAFIAGWIKYRRFSLINFLILMIGGGNLLSIILYAQNDYGRLMLPVSAFLILMGGLLLSCLHHRPLSIKLSGIFPKDDQPETKPD